MLKVWKNSSWVWLAAGDELDIVHEKEVRLAVLVPHLGALGGACLDGGHQFIGEVVALDVGDAGVAVVLPVTWAMA